MNAELSKPFRLFFKVLKIFGLWKERDQSRTSYRVGFVYYVISVYVYFFCQLIHIFLKEQTLEQFAHAIGIFTMYLALVHKSANFLKNINRIKKSMSNLTELLEFSAGDRWTSREKLQNQVNFVFKIYRALFLSSVITGAMSINIPIFNHELPVEVWLPFDAKRNSIVFWCTSLGLVANSAITAALGISLSICPVIFMAFAIGLIQELTIRMENIGHGTNTSLWDREEIIKCVEIHKKIKELVHEIQENFSSAIGFQGFLSSITICIIAFMLSLDQDASTYILFLTFSIPVVIQIFLPCYFGTLVSVSSSELSTAIFHSKVWYEKRTDAKLMLIFMENLKKDLKISSFSLFSVDLNNFTSIINFAYSMFALLKKINAN